ncbi:5-(carboxyamino)imidazole ribonucleotide mutase, partial [Candidatus Sumerlaeota bacterium]|nr:5-(carboxyamino)imidazole ribonucleotide mutase [Candidatus Sumerlaeota bacterium]
MGDRALSQQQSPLVGLIMGSLIDYEAVRPGIDLLEAWGVPYEMTIASAHRTPEKAIEWAATAQERGIEVIIAAAGLAAHLPGMVAGQTNLPVIGVPIESGALQGVDALYSIVQMPAGTPVATVGINGAINAAVLALQILCRVDERWWDTLDNHRRQFAAKIEQQNAQLRIQRPDAVWSGSQVTAIHTPTLAPTLTP